jgi:hypothetical protein
VAAETRARLAAIPCSACAKNPIRLADSGNEAEERRATCGHELIVVRLSFGRGDDARLAREAP